MLRIIRFFLLFIIDILAPLCLIMYSELTSYSFFDREGKTNILCDIDPFCRHLNSDEINIARTFFNSHINTRTIKVFRRRPFVFFNNDFVAAANEDRLYLGRHHKNDLKNQLTYNAVYVHEMTHIWQFQNKIPFGLLHIKKDEETYGEFVGRASSFTDLHKEDQANTMMILYQHLHYLEKMTDPKEIENTCTEIEKINQKTSEFLSSQTSAKCH